MQEKLEASRNWNMINSRRPSTGDNTNVILKSQEPVPRILCISQFYSIKRIYLYNIYIYIYIYIYICILNRKYDRVVG